MGGVLTTMRYGIPTCSEPKDPKSIYMRNAFHEFFWGPFKNEQEITAAVKSLNKADPYWDYDPVCIIYGADPLPKNFVLGFPFVDGAMKSRILAT